MTTRITFKIGENKVEGDLLPAPPPPSSDQGTHEFFKDLAQTSNQPFQDELYVKQNGSLGPQYYVARLWQSLVIYQGLEGKTIETPDTNQKFEVIKILQDEPDRAYPLSHVSCSFGFFTREGTLVPTTPEEHGIPNAEQLKKEILDFLGVKEGAYFGPKQRQLFENPSFPKKLNHQFGSSMTDARFSIEWDKVNESLSFKMILVPIPKKLKIELIQTTGTVFTKEATEKMEELARGLITPPFHHENVIKGVALLEQALLQDPDFMLDPHRKFFESISIGYSSDKELLICLKLMPVPREQWVDLIYLDEAGKPLKNEQTSITTLVQKSKLNLPLSRINVVKNIEQLRFYFLEKGYVPSRFLDMPDTFENNQVHTALQLRPVPKDVKFDTNIPLNTDEKKFLFRDPQTGMVTGASLQKGVERLLQISTERGYRLRNGEPKLNFTPQGLVISAHAQTLHEITIHFIRQDNTEEVIRLTKEGWQQRSDSNFLKEFEQKPGGLLDLIALERALYKIKSRYPIFLHENPAQPYTLEPLDPDHVRVSIPLYDVQPVYQLGVRGSAAPVGSGQWIGNAQASFTLRGFEGDQWGIQAGWLGTSDDTQVNAGVFWDRPWLNPQGLGLTLGSGYTHSTYYGEIIRAAAQLHVPLGGPHSSLQLLPGIQTSFLFNKDLGPTLRLQPLLGLQYTNPGKAQFSIQAGPSIDTMGRVYFEATVLGLKKFFLSHDQRLHLDIFGKAATKHGNVPGDDLFRSALVLQDYGAPLPDLNLAHAGMQANLVYDINEWIGVGAGVSGSVRRSVTGPDVSGPPNVSGYQTIDRWRFGAGLLLDAKLPFLTPVRVIIGGATEGDSILWGVNLGVPF